MSLKTNSRSFRYSDEVAAVLAQQPGKSENDKFEQLVLRCFYKLPELIKREGELQQSIMEKLEQLRTLQSLYENTRAAETKASNCVMELDRLYHQIGEVDQRLCKTFVTQKDAAASSPASENV